MHLTRALKFGGGVHYFNYSNIERFIFFCANKCQALTKNPSKSNDQMKDKLFLDAAGCPFEFTHTLGKYFFPVKENPGYINQMYTITIFSIEPIVLKGQKPTTLNFLRFRSITFF